VWVFHLKRDLAHDSLSVLSGDASQEIAVPVTRFQYVEDDGVTWRDYEQKTQATIVAAHDAFSRGQGPSTVPFTAGRESYHIDFVLGEQANTVTGKKRRVRHVP
jgi:hypothetical protein